MRAAIIRAPGSTPVLEEFREPTRREGAVLIDVETAGLGGWDVLGAYREGVEYPCVIRGEGVGRAPDGRRVYFGERSLAPFGAWAQRTIVPASEVWNVPDEVDDRTAITMSIAGTGAYLPLEKAEIRIGEGVLVLGATGVLGQLALQYARIMGAGRVVGAGRSSEALARLTERRIADATVRIGTEDDAAALKAEAGEGFDVVFDPIGGKPMLAALKATRWGARVVTVGVGAGINVNLNLADLLFRTLTVVGTGQRPPNDRERVWRKLLQLARDHRVEVDYADYPFDQIPEAWARQVASPHAKITSKIPG
jgi:NADPH:quinone reductase